MRYKDVIMDWYYEADGERQGPLDEVGLANAVESGLVSADTLVWNESLPNWTPYAEIVSIDSNSDADFSPAVQRSCGECGQSFAEDMMLNYEGSFICATCKPTFMQKIRQGVEVAGEVENGGMGRRLVAQWVDGFILGLVGMMLQFGVALAFGFIVGDDPSGVAVGTIIGMFLSYVLSAAYEGFFYSRTGSTPGKSMLQVKVVRSDGSLVSFWRGFGRYFARFLVALPLGIGLLAAFFDEHQRGWHDRMCDTRVVRI